MKTNAIVFFLAMLTLAGCGPSDNNVTQAVSDPKVKEASLLSDPIHWFEGSIEEGFALAKAKNNPVFLYWGAVWCPPCQEIKHTVFKSPQFIAQTKLFVPIYLDGDTDRAQAWGDTFGVKGYPTMIIFNPEGDEITRIPGGIDISRYNTILALSLNTMRPTSMLVELALTEPSKLGTSDFVQLAYYSWGQDSSSLPEGTPATFFRDVSELSDEPEASARLYMQYLTSLAEEFKTSESEDKSVEPAEPQSTEAYSRLMDYLDSTKLTLACWEYFGYYAKDIIGLPVFSEAELGPLKEKWQEKVLALRSEQSLSTAEQLTAWLPLLQFHFLDDNDALLPESIIVDLKADVKKADSETSNSYARQSVVSQIEYLLQSAKLYDEARELLLAELDKSASPYYFMSDLAYLEEEQGNLTEALEWRRKAYENSTGEATRFQWGASYVRAIIRITPEDKELVMASSMKLFDELQGDHAPFSGRNFRVLRKVNTQLSSWQSEQGTEELAQPFQSRIESLCERQKAPSLELDNCLTLTASPTNLHKPVNN
jgi:thiol-disulfide isomerase/thioredoxin